MITRTKPLWQQIVAVREAFLFLGKSENLLLYVKKFFRIKEVLQGHIKSVTQYFY